ncbi:MAG: oligosaccharide repeat unit polymerase [Euryarchaeota archaeon]|nr:oligosaccharide repeat unit polymerase [Euryarchaeota archaeon]
MIEELFERAAENIHESYKKSAFATLGSLFFSCLKRLPKLPSAGEKSVSPRYFHPSIFIVIFIVFLGLSDAPISLYGTATIFLGLLGFFLGTKVRFKSIRISEKFFFPLLAIFLICAGFMYYDWSLFSKLGFIPFFLLSLTGKKYCFELYLASFVLSLLVFFQLGYWAISAPYMFFSLTLMALTLRNNERYHIKKIKSFLVLFALLLPFSQYPSIVPFILSFWIFLLAYYLLMILVIGGEGRLNEILTGNIRNIALLLIFIGTLYWILDLIAYGGIPLLDPLGRGGLNHWYTMAAHLLPLGCILLISLVGMEMEKKKARTVTLLFAVFALVTMGFLGYRTQIALIIIGVLIASVFTELVTLEELTVLGGIGTLGLIGMTALRNIILHTEISVIEAVRYRVGLTLSSYDILAELGGTKGFTHGFVHIASYPPLAGLMPGVAYSPRRYIGIFVGAEGVSITSTILGPLVIDFGIMGVFVGMFFLGFLLKRAYTFINKTEGREKAIFIAVYSILLSYTIIGIETGLVDFEVLLIFFLSFLYILYRVRTP